MTKDELNTLVSSALSDGSSNFFNATERDLILEQAHRQINTELRLLRTALPIPTLAGTVAVPLPADFAATGRYAFWRSLSGFNTALEPVSYGLLFSTSPNWQTTPGTPAQISFYGAKAFLVPPPTADGTLVLDYVQHPTPLTATGSLPWNGDVRASSFTDCIVLYAAWMHAIKDRDFELAQYLFTNYSRRMVDFREALRHVPTTPEVATFVEPNPR